MGPQFYIYVMFRPWDGSPCYVGKGKGNRYREHAWKGASHYNPRLGKIFERAGGQIPVILLHTGLDEKKAFDYERALIAAIGRGRNGPLVNLTAGGEGVSGFKNPWSEEKRTKIVSCWTPEKRAKASDYWIARGHTFPEGASAKGGATWNGKRRSTFGCHLSIEHRAAIAASKMGKPHPHKSGRTGRPLSAAHKAAISMAKMGRPMTKPSPLKGVPKSVEIRAKISASLKQRFALAA